MDRPARRLIAISLLTLVASVSVAVSAADAGPCGRKKTCATDTTPPNTTITAGPSATTTSTSASFSFASSESGSSFSCRLDGGSWGACTSPKAYSGLSEGAHTFDVQARDTAGNADPTPASLSWTISASQPPPPPPPSSDTEPLGPRAVDLTPTGNVIYVNPGQSWSSAINAASPGDTVVVNAGSYPAQTISRALPAGENINVFAAQGATVDVAGLSLADAKGLTFRGFRLTGRTYLERSQRLTLQGFRITTSAGVIGIEVRDSSDDIRILDNTYTGPYIFTYLQAASNSTWPTNVRIQNNDSGPVSRDHIFISRGRWVWIERNLIHGITDTTEHTDGVQSVGGQDVYIRRNEFSDTRAMRDSALDRNDHALMLNSDPATSRYTQNVEISNNLIHDWVGTGVAVAGGPGLKLFNNTIYDCGLNGTGANAVVLDADPGNTVAGDVFNNILSRWYVGGATLARNDSNFVADGSGPAGTNRLTGDPGFVSTANADYRLAAASRNVNSASTSGAAADDLFGSPRDAQPDHGAVEYLP